MVFGLPVELWAGIGSYAISAFNSLNKAKQEREDQRHRFDMAVMAASNKANMEWFKAQNELVEKDPAFSVTRKFIAMFMVIGVVGGLLLLPVLFPGANWVVETTEHTDALFGLFTDSTKSYDNVSGVFYKEWMGSAVMSIIGFYFGQKAGSKN